MLERSAECCWAHPDRDEGTCDSLFINMLLKPVSLTVQASSCVFGPLGKRIDKARLGCVQAETGAEKCTAFQYARQ